MLGTREPRAGGAAGGSGGSGAWVSPGAREVERRRLRMSCLCSAVNKAVLAAGRAHAAGVMSPVNDRDLPFGRGHLTVTKALCWPGAEVVWKYLPSHATEDLADESAWKRVGAVTTALSDPGCLLSPFFHKSFLRKIQVTDRLSSQEAVVAHVTESLYGAAEAALAKVVNRIDLRSKWGGVAKLRAWALALRALGYGPFARGLFLHPKAVDIAARAAAIHREALGFTPPPVTRAADVRDVPAPAVARIRAVLAEATSPSDKEVDAFVEHTLGWNWATGRVLPVSWRPSRHVQTLAQILQRITGTTFEGEAEALSSPAARVALEERVWEAFNTAVETVLFSVPDPTVPDPPQPNEAAADGTMRRSTRKSVRPPSPPSPSPPPPSRRMPARKRVSHASQAAGLGGGAGLLGGLGPPPLKRPRGRPRSAATIARQAAERASARSAAVKQPPTGGALAYLWDAAQVRSRSLLSAALANPLASTAVARNPDAACLRVASQAIQEATGALVAEARRRGAGPVALELYDRDPSAAAFRTAVLRGSDDVVSTAAYWQDVAEAQLLHALTTVSNSAGTLSDALKRDVNKTLSSAPPPPPPPPPAPTAPAAPPGLSMADLSRLLGSAGAAVPGVSAPMLASPYGASAPPAPPSAGGLAHLEGLAALLQQQQQQQHQPHQPQQQQYALPGAPGALAGLAALMGGAGSGGVPGAAISSGLGSAGLAAATARGAGPGSVPLWMLLGGGGGGGGALASGTLPAVSASPAISLGLSAAGSMASPPAIPLPAASRPSSFSTFPAPPPPPSPLAGAKRDRVDGE